MNTISLSVRNTISRLGRGAERVSFFVLNPQYREYLWTNVLSELEKHLIATQHRDLGDWSERWEEEKEEILPPPVDVETDEIVELIQQDSIYTLSTYYQDLENDDKAQFIAMVIESGSPEAVTYFTYESFFPSALVSPVLSEFSRIVYNRVLTEEMRNNLLTFLDLHEYTVDLVSFISREGEAFARNLEVIRIVFEHVMNAHARLVLDANFSADLNALAQRYLQ